MKWEMIIIFGMILIFAGYKYWLDKQNKKTVTGIKTTKQNRRKKK